MLFADRIDAANRLASELQKYRGLKPLMLGIPRGAVSMARVIADRLAGEVDVVLVRKLGAPGNAEFAIGAVDETGWPHVSDHAPSSGGDATCLQTEKEAQIGVLRARRAAYTVVRPRMNPKDRIAIVVDDGLATGATMIVALHALRARYPAKLICAGPVAPVETIEEVSRHCDEMVRLETPQNFYAVGQFYLRFDQVSDAEVVAALKT